MRKQIQIAQIRHEPQCTYTVQSMAMEIPRVHDKCYNKTTNLGRQHINNNYLVIVSQG